MSIEGGFIIALTFTMIHSETASINFLKWDPLYETEKPFQVFIEEDLAQSGQRNTNLRWEEQDVTVEDIRDDLDYVNIDDHGFTTRNLLGFDCLNSAEEIESWYLPAVEQLLRAEMDDAGTVFIYDWRVYIVFLPHNVSN